MWIGALRRGWWLWLAIAICTACPGAGATDPPPDAGGPGGPGAPREVVVYAAASLRDVLEALSPSSERALGLRPVFNVGASSDLARQIAAAGKADVFFSADEAWMDTLDAQGLVDRASRRSLLGNGLVVVAPADSALRLDGPQGLAASPLRRLSLADPDVVPAGKYAQAWLQATGQWETLRERVVPALDVRAALAAVASGATDAGIVYRTDARLTPAVRVVLAVPAGEAPTISYPLAALAGRPGLEDARRFVAWLAGPDAAQTFREFGFDVRREAAAR